VTSTADALQREVQMRMALQAGRMGTWDWDIATDRLSWADGHEHQLWAEAPDSYQGTYAEFAAFMHPEDRDGQHRAIQHAVDTHGEYAHVYRVVFPGDNVRWVAARGRASYDAAGRPLRMVGVYQDVTEQRRMQEQFQQAQRIDAIGQLAGGIAHDFNNILGAIIGHAALARRDMAAGHSPSQSLQEIEKASQRAKNLVQQILAFGRKQPIEKQIVALQPLVEESASLLRATLPANVALTTACTLEVPCVLADTTQLHQVLLNLGTNAWHALKGRSGCIEMRLALVPATGESAPIEPILRGELSRGSYVRLSVTDNGAGMDEATLRRIFEPFFTTKAQGHGTGLGLAVVDDIVRSHGGAISVLSQPGRGSTFNVYFPALEGRLPIAATAPIKSLIPAPGGGEHILYLDDEEVLVRLTRRILEPVGYRVHGFTRASQALVAFRANPSLFDLAISDLTMPDSNGLEVIGELRAVRPDLPVILTTGFITDDLRKRAQAIGVTHVLCKPVAASEFCDVVRRVLRARQGA
jgi:signal transduction histidine kinase/ActR/RegA family two-component response regulator